MGRERAGRAVNFPELPRRRSRRGKRSGRRLRFTIRGRKAMSPKKTILKTLAELGDDEGGPSSIHPSKIPGFQDRPGKFQETINGLLKDRFIEGARDAQGRMAISLNAHRARDVQKILRPVWAHPAVLVGAALVAAVAGFGFLS
jgi:hypothetical protein